MPRGRFIVIEGLDRSGKSTQCDKLHSSIPDSILLKFPDRSTTIGGIIDDYLSRRIELDDHAIHLLFSANRWELSKSIIETIKSGKDIICDRYALSGLVYSLSKGLDTDFCKASDKGLPRPDITIFMDLDTEESRNRAGFGGERYEDVQLQKEVRKRFMDNIGDSIVLNAARDIQTIHEEIKRIVDTLEVIGEIRYL